MNPLRVFVEIDVTQAAFKKTKGALLPADEDARELIAAMPIGEDVLVDYKRGRSVQNHRRFFSFVNHTFEWQDEFDNKEIWLYVLKIRAGHFHPVIGKNGTTQYVPKSINFNSVDETEFKAFFNNVIDGYLQSDYAKNLTDQQLTLITHYWGLQCG